MISKRLAPGAAVVSMLVVCACGGGGGGSAGPQPPAPPPPPSGDSTPPDTTLTGGPAPTTAQRSASFTLASNEANSTFEASLDGAEYVVVTSPYTLSDLADGTHTLNVRARDAANNVDASPASHTWVVDGTAPTVRILFPGGNAYTDAGSILVRGTAQDAGTIASLTINGAAATSDDGFRNWSANVDVDSGTNTFTIATADDLGNSNASAATVSIVNRGVQLSLLRALALDVTNNRVLTTDWELNAIVEIGIDDGVARVFSDASHGTGDNLSNPRGMFVDAPRDRLLVWNDQRVMEIDLATGNREQIGPAPTPDTIGYGGLTYDAATDRVYVASGYPNGVIAIDLTNGTRWVLSNNDVFGTGPAFIQASDLVLDTSTVGGGERLIVSDVGAIPGRDPSRLMEVDLATGNRTLLSSSGPSGRGTGPAMLGIGDLAIDAANNRLLVMQYEETGTTKLLAVDLSTGDRTLLADTEALGASAMLAFQPGAAHAYLGLGDRARVLSFSLSNQQLDPFFEGTVGTGPAGAQYNSLFIDSSGATTTLLAAAQLSPFGGSGGALRIDPSTGARTLVTGGDVGTGEIIRTANSVQRDTRAGAPPNQLLAFDNGSGPSRLFAVDAMTGARSVLHPLPDVAYYSLRDMTLDAPNGRLLAGVRGGYFEPYTLTGIDVATGSLTPIAGVGLGTGPDLGDLVAIEIDAPADGPRRFVVASVNPFALLAVDPSNGDRTVISSSGPEPRGTGPAYDLVSGLEIDSAGRRALVFAASGTLLSVDLGNGDRTALSGVDPADPSTVIGIGPRIRGYGPKLRADFAAGVAYVSVSDSLFVIDLATGQRAILSR